MLESNIYVHCSQWGKKKDETNIDSILVPLKCVYITSLFLLLLSYSTKDYFLMWAHNSTLLENLLILKLVNRIDYS